MSLINRAFFPGFIPGFASFHRFTISRLKPFLFAALVIRVSRSGPLSPSPLPLLSVISRLARRKARKRKASYRRWKRAAGESAEGRKRERERDHADCFSQTKTAELRTRREGQGRDVSRGLGKRFVIPTPLDIFILPPMQIFISRTKTCAALLFSFFVVA